MNASASSAFRHFVRSALLCLLVAPMPAQQPAGSDYTTALPSVEKIKTQIQGTDPIDTAARQAAVLEYLPVYIDRIRVTRGYRAPFTAGEQKHLTDYSLALYQLKQDFTKSHSADEVKRFNQLESDHSFDARGWITQLEGQQAADTYRGAESSLAQTYQQHEAQLQQQMKQDNGQSSGGLFGGGGGGPLDADQKRCLELGGSYDECAGAMMGLMKGMGSLLTLSASNNSGNETPPLSGVILVGSYRNRAELPELALSWDGRAILQKCGTLVDSDHTYTLRKSGLTTQIVVDNEPEPIVLTLHPDGSLSGPGSISVKGQIITGYSTTTKQVMVNGASAAAQGYSCNGPCSTTTSLPVFAPSMQRCTLSVLASQPPPPPPPKQTGLVADIFGSAADPVESVYGFRVAGPYTSSNGMQLSFENRFVTLDCGKAHIHAPYTVDNTSNGFVIHVQNSGGAFLLAVAPDNTLRGTGSTTVNGKLVSSVNGKVVNFTPHSESCNVGTFAPKGKRNTMLASNARMPIAPTPDTTSPEIASSASAPPSSAPNSMAAALAGAGISGTPSGARAQLRILLSSTFTGVNPLANQSVFVTRQPMDQILRELGVAVPARATSAQAMKALQAQCRSPQGCSSILQGLTKYYVTTAKFDPSGKATLNATAATGPYYFFAIVPSGTGSVVWDVPANLAAGDNSVTFSQANAERIQ